MLLLWVPGSGVGAALHQEERRLAGAPGAVPLLSTPHGSPSLPQCSDVRNKADIHTVQIQTSVVEPDSEPEPQEPQLFALVEPELEPFRFRNLICTRIQHKM